MKFSLRMLVLFAACLLSGTLSAQDSKSDKVVMMSGEEKMGKVTEIGDDFVRFVHEGESLTYTLKKSEINKIQFASGRIEVITQTSEAQPGALADHHNLVAVLPFAYIGMGGARDDKMSKKVQQDCYNDLKKYAKQFTIQDPVTTNALLIKHNVTQETIEGFTPVELTQILGVEYILMGTITINQTSTNTGFGGYHSDTNKGKKTTGYTAGGATTYNNYETNVDMSIYNDQGTSVFSKSHTSFWQDQNSYTITLQYLLKRTPLYSK